jgi:GT2 family glycosyltransferase
LVTSILIVDYEGNVGSSPLDKCLESINRYTLDYEILVHRNTPQMNLGFARANNLLLRRARGRYVVLLNPDTVVTSNWLTYLLERAESSDRIGIVQPKLLNPGGSIDSTGHIFLRPGIVRDRGYGQSDFGQYDKSTQLESAIFACVLMKREMISQIGILDEKLFMYMEDVDYCLRARGKGWQIVYEPRSIVYHFRGGVGGDPTKGYQYVPRVIIRNYPFKTSFSEVLRFLFMNGLGIAAGFVNRDPEYSQRKIWAIWNGLRLLHG